MWAVAATVVVGLAAACGPPPAPTAPLQRVDVATGGAAANDGCCWVDGYATQSADGRHVLFNSVATNLVTGDTNAGAPMTLDGLDWFVRDRVAGTTTRVSIRPGGGEFTTAEPVVPFAGGMSANGDHVVFVVDDQSQRHLYRWDRSTGQTSLMVAFGPGDPWASGPLEVSDDGTVVAFAAVVPPGSARRAVVFVDGQGFSDLGTAENSQVRLSADGRYVAADDVVHDRQGATATPLVAGGPGTDVVIAMSSDGRYVLFSTDRVGLVAADTNAADDLYVKDTVTSTYRLATTGGGAAGITPSGGWALNSLPFGPGVTNVRYPLGSISDDGDTVAFLTDADDVVATDQNGGWDLFVRDLGTSATDRVTDDYDQVPFARWQVWGGRFLSADGSRVVLTGRRSGTAGLWSQPV